MAEGKLIQFRRRTIDETLAAGEDAAALTGEIADRLTQVLIRIKIVNAMLETLLRDGRSAA